MRIDMANKVASIAGSLAAVVSAMGCAMCFPAMATLAGAMGMGFLSQWEGVFVNTLLPVFGWVVLVVNVAGWFFHRQWWRSLLGAAGPVLLLLSLYPWFQYGWSSDVTYTALGMMVVVSVLDFLLPVYRHCTRDGCELSPSVGGENQ